MNSPIFFTIIVFLMLFIFLFVVGGIIYAIIKSSREDRAAQQNPNAPKGPNPGMRNVGRENSQSEKPQTNNS